MIGALVPLNTSTSGITRFSKAVKLAKSPSLTRIAVVGAGYPSQCSSGNTLVSKVHKHDVYKT